MFNTVGEDFRQLGELHEWWPRTTSCSELEAGQVILIWNVRASFWDHALLSGLLNEGTNLCLPPEFCEEANAG
jgi:hypothetical protein